MNDYYKQKYLKYKTKYILLKNQNGGTAWINEFIKKLIDKINLIKSYYPDSIILVTGSTALVIYLYCHKLLTKDIKIPNDFDFVIESKSKHKRITDYETHEYSDYTEYKSKTNDISFDVFYTQKISEYNKFTFNDYIINLITIDRLIENYKTLTFDAELTGEQENTIKAREKGKLAFEKIKILESINNKECDNITKFTISSEPKRVFKIRSLNF